MTGPWYVVTRLLEPMILAISNVTFVAPDEVGEGSAVGCALATSADILTADDFAVDDGNIRWRLTVAHFQANHGDKLLDCLEVGCCQRRPGSW